MATSEDDAANQNETSASAELTTTLTLDSDIVDPHQILFGDSKVSVQLPVPDAKVYNNLAEYYSKTFPKKSHNNTLNASNSRQQVNPSISTNDASGSANLKRSMPQQSRTRGQKVNVLDRMQQSKGPLSLLYRSLRLQLRVLVRRRKATLLREERFSWLTGLLIAFDSHLNMALQDVCEEYCHQRTPTGPTVIVRKLTKQLLVRGDNVVLVSNNVSHQPNTDANVPDPSSSTPA